MVSLDVSWEAEEEFVLPDINELKSSQAGDA